MYNYIKGKIAEINENTIVVECGGIGYELNVSANAASEFSGKEGEVKIYCYLCVREDDMSLFGFASKQEKTMFLKLISVSGVGPKLALTVLSGMNADGFAAAVVRSDTAALSKIKGVGKKTAERIALELKDKVSKEYDVSIDSAAPTVAVSVNEDAVMALMTLGYSRQEAADAVGRVQTDGMTLEQLIFAAIKNA
ncbi:MAG: Holliday junction branch migration protein RuvA [Christensenellales bacterium]